MKQKVLVVVHDASNEYDSSSIQIVSWQDGSVIENMPLIAQYLGFAKHFVEQVETSSKLVWDAPELPFSIPEKMTTEEYKTIEKKIWDFNKQWCNDNDVENKSIFPNEPYWDVFYKESNLNKHNEYKLRQRFVVEDSDEVYAQRENAFCDRMKLKHPGVKFTKDSTFYPKQRQEYALLCLAHTERTFDNGKEWFDNIPDVLMRKFYKELYDKDAYLSTEPFVEQLMEKTRPQYEIINIIYA